MAKMLEMMALLTILSTANSVFDRNNDLVQKMLKMDDVDEIHRLLKSNFETRQLSFATEDSYSDYGQYEGDIEHGKGSEEWFGHEGGEGHEEEHGEEHRYSHEEEHGACDMAHRRLSSDGTGNHCYRRLASRGRKPRRKLSAGLSMGEGMGEGEDQSHTALWECPAGFAHPFECMHDHEEHEHEQKHSLFYLPPLGFTPGPMLSADYAAFWLAGIMATTLLFELTLHYAETSFRPINMHIITKYLLELQVLGLLSWLTVIVTQAVQMPVPNEYLLVAWEFAHLLAFTTGVLRIFEAQISVMWLEHIMDFPILVVNLPADAPARLRGKKVPLVSGPGAAPTAGNEWADRVRDPALRSGVALTADLTSAWYLTWSRVNDQERSEGRNQSIEFWQKAVIADLAAGSKESTIAVIALCLLAGTVYHLHGYFGNGIGKETALGLSLFIMFCAWVLLSISERRLAAYIALMARYTEQATATFDVTTAPQSKDQRDQRRKTLSAQRNKFTKEVLVMLAADAVRLYGQAIEFVEIFTEDLLERRERRDRAEGSAQEGSAQDRALRDKENRSEIQFLAEVLRQGGGGLKFTGALGRLMSGTLTFTSQICVSLCGIGMCMGMGHVDVEAMDLVGAASTGDGLHESRAHGAVGNGGIGNGIGSLLPAYQPLTEVVNILNGGFLVIWMIYWAPLLAHEGSWGWLVGIPLPAVFTSAILIPRKLHYDGFIIGSAFALIDEEETLRQHTSDNVLPDHRGSSLL